MILARRMKALLSGISAILISFGVVFAAAAPAFAATVDVQQSWLYPPEVPFRAVIVVDDPSLQRRYWDPRFCDCVCCPRRHAAGTHSGAWR